MKIMTERDSENDGDQKIMWERERERFKNKRKQKIYLKKYHCNRGVLNKD